MTETEQKKVGRLAFRVEGNKWTCYYAKADTMEDAIWMGTIAMAIVEDLERKQAFMDLMRSALADFLEARTGQRPTWEEYKAPEHERSGSA